MIFAGEWGIIHTLESLQDIHPEFSIGTLRIGIGLWTITMVLLWAWLVLHLASPKKK